MARIPVCLTIAALLIITSLAARQSFAQSNTASPPNPFGPDTPGGSHAATDLRLLGPNADNAAGWLFPITRLNQSLPSWIQFGGQFRNRTEGQDGLDYQSVDDVYNLTQLRLGVYIQATKWLKLVGVIQDARVFFNHHIPNGSRYQNTWDIREAYLQLGSSNRGWFNIVAGRQMFSFGDERVIGPSDWSNMGRTFDTVRLDVHHEGSNVSIFAASVISSVDGRIDHHIQGNNIYGIYASLAHLIPHTTVEPYVLWRVAPSNISLPETAGLGHMSEVTTGIRLAGTLPADLDYDVEMNKQTGSLGAKSIDAWAGHWNLGYTFRNALSQSRIYMEYNYASGNKNPNGNTWGTHDQIYAAAHNKMDFADQFSWKNIEEIRAGVTEKLGKKWVLTQIFNDMWLATKNDALYSESGGIAVAAHPDAASRHIGTELDLIAEYKQNRHVTYGFGFAHLFGGRFLKEATPGKDLNYPFAYVTYIF
jgi:hypothetical protein